MGPWNPFRRFRGARASENFSLSQPAVQGPFDDCTRMALLGCFKSAVHADDDERAMQRAARLPLRKRIGRSLARRRSEKVAPAPPHESVSERTLIMLGCDGAGKSTLVAAMRGGDVSKVTPTVGFDPHKCVLDGAPLRLFDVGGGEKIRGIWKCYYMEVHAAVFVVDASDPARFDEARALLHEAYTTDTLAGKPLLILANKATLPQAAAEAAVAEGLRLSELPAGAPYHVCAGSASVETGDALFRDETRASPSGPHGGLTWLLRRVGTEGSALEARVARQMEEEKARAERAREERRERLAAKRAAKEAAEAEAAAAAAREAGDSGGGGGGGDGGGDGTVTAPPSPPGGDNGGGVGMARGVPAGKAAAVQGAGAGADADAGGRTLVPSGVGAAGGESGVATPPPAGRSPGEPQACSRGS